MNEKKNGTIADCLCYVMLRVGINRGWWRISHSSLADRGRKTITIYLLTVTVQRSRAVCIVYPRLSPPTSAQTFCHTGL